MQALELAQYSAAQIVLAHALQSPDEESRPEDSRRLELPLHVLALKAVLVVAIVEHGFFERSGFPLSWNRLVDRSGDLLERLAQQRLNVLLQWDSA